MSNGLASISIQHLYQAISCSTRSLVGERAGSKGISQIGVRSIAKLVSIGGRELRLAAVLARLEAQKEEQAVKESAPSDRAFEDDLDSTTEDDYEKDEDDTEDKTHMVKVCEDDDATDSNVKQEMDELRGLAAALGPSFQLAQDAETTDEESPEATHQLQGQTKDSSASLGREPHVDDDDAETTDGEGRVVKTHNDADTSETVGMHRLSTEETRDTLPSSSSTGESCPICSMSNEPETLRCTACLHVLDKVKIFDSWNCQSETCSADYINAGDCNLCGICGSRKPTERAG